MRNPVMKNTVIMSSVVSRLMVGGAMLLAVSGVALPSLGQDARVPTGELGVRAIEAQVVVDSANVRSGPGENYYSTTRLPRGTKVTVVGFTFDWLKIAPPAGSFSLISKQYVEVAADGKSGRVKADRVNVRAGSELVATDTTIQLQLSNGDAVTVIGESGQFFKITPPGGAFLYVRKDMVQPMRDLGPVPAEVSAPARPSVAAVPATGAAPTTVAPAAGETGIVVTPAVTPAAPVVEVRQPSAAELEAAKRQAAAEKAYDAAESKLAAAAGLPLEEQPLPELLAAYEALSENPDLPGTLRLQAQRQAAVLKGKSGTRDELLELRRLKEQQAATSASFSRQQDEVFGRLNATANTAYTAIGQLRTSQISSGGKALLRLVDPGTGLTVIYVRSDDASLLDQLVGVRGPVTDDPVLGVKIVESSGFSGVSPGEVGKTVTGNFMPPSLLPPVARP